MTRTGDLTLPTTSRDRVLTERGGIIHNENILTVKLTQNSLE